MDGKLNAYRTANTLGKSQLDLIIQVYDGAISSFAAASDAFRTENFEKGHLETEKARKFVTHLYTTLDMEKGGEIAEQLSKLYSFVINQSHVIDATKDLAKIDDNITILRNVRQGWVSLKELQAKEQMPKVQPVTVNEEQFTTSA